MRDSVLKSWIAGWLAAAVACSAISIFLTEVCFGLALVGWAYDCFRSRRLQFRMPPYFPWVLAFLAAVLLSIAFSQDAIASVRYLKKFSRFLLAGLVFTYFSTRHVRGTCKALILLLGASAVHGILQYFWLKEVDLLHRITGFMSHWMTFSGQLMLAATALSAWMLFDLGVPGRSPEAQRGAAAMFRRLAPWGLVLALLLFALVLSMTRNAWLGCLVGLATLLAVRSWRLSVAGAVAVVLVFLLLPAPFKERFYSGFNRQDTTTRVRLELLHTGVNIVKAHPWTGVGPRLVRRVYPQYRVTQEFPGWAYQHLHNDAVQIAAEMGLIALAVWLALWAAVAWGLVRVGRRALENGDLFVRSLALGGLASLAAFLTAGFFEYNFGDSEVLILLLFLVTAPYVVSRDQKEAA
jgi:O-antigen ligase